eukprot:GILK01013454.1.p1 GENE.GILK01013454.1~~GILK01013454.1.p1  ORF type:complete len:117 (+),score=5.58 GILK01013454.1:228-578(+)
MTSKRGFPSFTRYPDEEFTLEPPHIVRFLAHQILSCALSSHCSSSCLLRQPQNSIPGGLLSETAAKHIPLDHFRAVRRDGGEELGFFFTRIGDKRCYIPFVVLLPTGIQRTCGVVD